MEKNCFARVCSFHLPRRCEFWNEIRQRVMKRSKSVYEIYLNALRVDIFKLPPLHSILRSFQSPLAGSLNNFG